MSDESKNPYAKSPEGGLRSGRLNDYPVTHEELGAVVDRVVALENWRTDERVKDVQNQSVNNNMKDRFDRLDQEVQSIKGAVNRALWIVGGAILMAFIGWILQGGLASG